LSNVEISEILDISLKTVEGHITKAFKLLRNDLVGSKN
jgi:DNA-binding CsgD family transcriptional regulator